MAYFHPFFIFFFFFPSYRASFRITSTHHGCEKSEWANVLKKGATVCVECQPVAMSREIGMRCKGHGVKDAHTAWKAVDVPHCHGVWVMTSGHEAQTCDYDIEDEQRKNFIFI